METCSTCSEGTVVVPFATDTLFIAPPNACSLKCQNTCGFSKEGIAKLPDNRTTIEPRLVRPMAPLPLHLGAYSIQMIDSQPRNHNFQLHPY